MLKGLSMDLKSEMSFSQESGYGVCVWLLPKPNIVLKNMPKIKEVYFPWSLINIANRNNLNPLKILVDFFLATNKINSKFGEGLCSMDFKNLDCHIYVYQNKSVCTKTLRSNDQHIT